jgi:hypothetical protein
MIPIHKAVIAWNEETKKVAVLLHCPESKQFCGPEMRKRGLNQDVGASSISWKTAPSGYLYAEFMSIALELICLRSFDPSEVLKAISQVEEIHAVILGDGGLWDLEWRPL